MRVDEVWLSHDLLWFRTKELSLPKLQFLSQTLPVSSILNEIEC